MFTRSGENTKIIIYDSAGADVIACRLRVCVSARRPGGPRRECTEAIAIALRSARKNEQNADRIGSRSRRAINGCPKEIATPFMCRYTALGGVHDSPLHSRRAEANSAAVIVNDNKIALLRMRRSVEIESD